MSKIILASASPRRREILQKLGLTFEVLVADVDDRLAWMADRTVCTDAFFEALVLQRETMGRG